MAGPEAEAGAAGGGDGEFTLIAEVMAPLAGDPGALGLSDDAAVIATGAETVATADALVAGVHFLPRDPADRIARKMLRVNLSDLAAMGAMPRAYLCTLALPEGTGRPWLERFAEGLREDLATYGGALVGGDLVSTPGPLTLSLTALGDPPPGGAVRRNGARPGDLLLVSGTLGDGALGLEAAQGGLLELDAEHRLFLEDRYRLPRPRMALGRAVAGRVTAMMDISDGLLADLGHICRTSGVGAEVRAGDLPLSPALEAVLADTPERLDAVLSGGDDYELLMAAPPDAAQGLIAEAEALGERLTMVGRITEESDITVVDRTGAPLGAAGGGWTHF